MNRYSNPRDAAPWEAGGLETGPGDRGRERVPMDANFPIISRAVYYFSVTNNLEFNTNDGRGIVVNAELSIPYERRDESSINNNFYILSNNNFNWKIRLKKKLLRGSLEN